MRRAATKRKRSLWAGALTATMLLAHAFAANPEIGSVNPLVPGDDWRSYNKTLDGQRYSPLDQINVANASTLKEVCRVDIAHRGSF